VETEVVCVEHLHNASSSTKERTPGVTSKRFLFSPIHVCVLEMESHLRKEEGSVFNVGT
jgi:hypothetical protein